MDGDLQEDLLYDILVYHEWPQSQDPRSLSITDSDNPIVINNQSWYSVLGELYEFFVRKRRFVKCQSQSKLIKVVIFYVSQFWNSYFLNRKFGLEIRIVMFFHK